MKFKAGDIVIHNGKNYRFSDGSFKNESKYKGNVYKIKGGFVRDDYDQIYVVDHRDKYFYENQLEFLPIYDTDLWRALS